ncbi:hypothetical protein PoB_006192200 [Plakobranchus ocellatus]|uniref:Uncharacterized protein n=1 Tax=Plakobranchus ocellatus TaxID=259542 RepID=A0AAV4CU33_9GAST|nr:hypothetical protein PoB_006192200 [Plakobranchus ocellatus]
MSEFEILTGRAALTAQWRTRPRTHNGQVSSRCPPGCWMKQACLGLEKNVAGRETNTFTGNLNSWAAGEGSNKSLIKLSDNWFQWRTMIVNVCSRQGTLRRTVSIILAD